MNVRSPNRRWGPGWLACVGGVWFRIQSGRKSDEDLRLEIYTDGRWLAVPMVIGFFLADFFCENENHLYPNGRGGQMYLDFCSTAANQGYREAEIRLEVMKTAKRARGPAV